MTPADNASSNNIPKLNQIESPSTPVNHFVAACIISLDILELFEISAAKEQMQTIPRVVTKGRWLTSDEHIRLYEQKVKKIRKENEAKEKRKADREQRKIENNIGCKRGGVRTRVGLTHQKAQRLAIKTRWGKQGSFFRPADKEIKE